MQTDSWLPPWKKATVVDTRQQPRAPSPVGWPMPPDHRPEPDPPQRGVWIIGDDDDDEEGDRVIAL